MIDVEGPSLLESGVFPEQMVLSWIRKKAEQAMGSKPLSSVSPWPLLRFLPPGLCLGLLP